MATDTRNPNTKSTPKDCKLRDLHTTSCRATHCSLSIVGHYMSGLKDGLVGFAVVDRSFTTLHRTISVFSHSQEPMLLIFFLRLSRHIHSRPCADSVLASPQTRHSLQLCVEVQAWLAVESVCASSCNRLLVSCEAEHWQRYWDRYVDTDLPSLDLFLEFTSCGARCRENGGSVAVFVVVDEFDRVVECWHVQADEDRTEDLFLVALHVLGHVCDDGWSDLRGVSTCLFRISVQRCLPSCRWRTWHPLASRHVHQAQ